MFCLHLAISRNTLNLFNVLVNVLSSEMFWLFCCSNWPLIMSPSGLNCLLPALQMHRTFKIKNKWWWFRPQSVWVNNVRGFLARWMGESYEILVPQSHMRTIWEGHHGGPWIRKLQRFLIQSLSFWRDILNSPSRFIYILVCWFSSVVPILAAWMVE